MIRFGLRLTLTSGREAAVRLALIASAVAIGVGLLLAILAGVNAVNTQNQRFAWLNSGVGAATAGTNDPLWWRVRGDYFDGQTIGRVDVAATGPHAPIPPGVPRVPGAGEFYASPAMDRLLRSTPADELGDRFSGHEIGIIGPAALPAPNSLVIIIGHTTGELSQADGATQITSIMTVPRNECGDNCFAGIDAAGIDLILSVVAAGLLFPVLILIATATRLAAARREQRFAAMRLVGATPRQISIISTVESTVATIAGTAVGFGLFYAFRRPIAGIPFTGAPFFPSDLSPNLIDILLVAVGIPVAGAITARLALRRVQISPLGVTRRVTPQAPRAWRLIPLAIGIGELVYFVGRRPATTNGQVSAYLSGVLLMMVGLVVAGPWLTMLGSRAMARRASRPAALLAARRISDNPQAAFRAVSGLMLALFITSAATGIITAVEARGNGSADLAVADNAIAKIFWPDPGDKAHPGPTASAIPGNLRAAAGARSLTIVYANPNADPRQPGRQQPGLVRCSDLARNPSFGSCSPGATVAEVYPDFTGPRSNAGPQAWTAAQVDPATLAGLPVLSVVLDTDGSHAAIERARTTLEVAFPQGDLPATDADFRSDSNRLLVQFQQLANVIILASLPIAGCSLAVAVAGGLADRKRPFSVLRLTGARLAILQRVVALESAVPLLVVAVVAIGAGFLAAQLFLASQLGYSLMAPGFAYYLVVIAGLAVSLGIIGSTLPLLKRITGPEAARNE